MRITETQVRLSCDIFRLFVILYNLPLRTSREDEVSEDASDARLQRTKKI